MSSTKHHSLRKRERTGRANLERQKVDMRLLGAGMTAMLSTQLTSFWSDGDVLKLDRSDGLHNSVTHSTSLNWTLKTGEVYGV